MSLVRLDLSQEMNDLRREVNRAFSAVPFAGSVFAGDRWIPPLDIVQKEDRLIVHVDLPGMDQKDIEVEVVGDQLMIHGKRKIEREQKDLQWYRYERAVGEFERSLQIPDGVDPEQVTAAFDQGVLTVDVPIPGGIVPAAKRIMVTSGSES